MLDVAGSDCGCDCIVRILTVRTAILACFCKVPGDNICCNSALYKYTRLDRIELDVAGPVA